jgi:hypothetical protein
MTASLFVTGIQAASVSRHRWEDEGDTVVPVGSVAHAVAKPVVDGLESSVCGLLVTATAADDWLSVRDAPRCEECSRIAG